MVCGSCPVFTTIGPGGDNTAVRPHMCAAGAHSGQSGTLHTQCDKMSLVAINKVGPAPLSLITI